jgi:hypothetical protein
MHIWVKISLYFHDCGPEKGILCIHLLWVVLCVVARPVSDGLQPAWQGLHEAYHVFHQQKPCSKLDFIYKIAVAYFQAL